MVYTIPVLYSFFVHIVCKTQCLQLYIIVVNHNNNKYKYRGKGGNYYDKFKRVKQ